jgi:hypothetical protein
MKSRSTTAQTTRTRTEDGRLLKLEVRHVLAAHHVIERDLADTIDIDKSLLGRRIDVDNNGAHLLLVDVARMPAPVQVDVLRILASRLGFDVVPVATGMSAINGVMLAASMLTAASEVATDTIKASADGRLDCVEAVPLRARGIALREKANSIINTCDLAIKDGAAPLTSNPNAPRGEA